MGLDKEENVWGIIAIIHIIMIAAIILSVKMSSNILLVGGLILLEVYLGMDSLYKRGTYEAIQITLLGGKVLRKIDGRKKAGLGPKLPIIEFVGPGQRASTKKYRIDLKRNFESGGPRCWKDDPRYDPVGSDSGHRIDSIPTDIHAEIEVDPNLIEEHLSFHSSSSGEPQEVIEGIKGQLSSIVHEIFVKYPNSPTIRARFAQIEEEARDSFRGIVWERGKTTAESRRDQEQPNNRKSQDLAFYYGVRLATLQITDTEVPQIILDERYEAEAETARSERREIRTSSYRDQAVEILVAANIPKHKQTPEMIMAVMKLLMVQDKTVSEEIKVFGLTEGTLEHIYSLVKAFKGGKP